MSTNRVPNILVVGAVVIDHTFSMKANQAFSIDGKFEPEHVAFRLGGGAGNCVQALKEIDNAYGTVSNVHLVTRIGQPPEANLSARIAQELTLDILSRQGVPPTDVTTGPNIIPINSVIEHPDGRVIVKGPIGDHATMAPGIENTIKGQVYGADIVFIDPRKPKMALIAARAANDLGKPLMIDWGEKAWPEDKETAEVYTELLTRADIVMIPSDAVVAGMPANVENPDELFQRMRLQYSAKNILMSNGGKKVRTFIEEQENTIDIKQLEGAKYMLAAGDTRNAGVLRALANGCDMLTAFAIGTHIASVKIKYPGLTWSKHLAHELPDYAACPQKRQVLLDSTMRRSCG